MNTHLWESAARRKLGVSADWLAYAWEMVGKDCIVTGAVPTGFVTKGPRKGKPIWKGEGTKVIVTEAEGAAEPGRYEQETGKCSACLGKGQTFLSWGSQTGLKTETCKTCAGDGKCAAAERWGL